MLPPSAPDPASKAETEVAARTLLSSVTGLGQTPEKSPFHPGNGVLSGSSRSLYLASRKAQETCGRKAAFEKWASAHFSFVAALRRAPDRGADRFLGKVTETQQERNRADTARLRAEIQARLSAREPDVEVLLVELARSGRSPVLRIFLDRPGGVDHELCARATGHLRDLLRDYTVEISSPGPARPLTKPEHYRRFTGRNVRVRTTELIDGRSDFKGELIDSDEQAVTLAGEWGTVTIPLERVRQSKLVPEPIEVPRP